MSDIKDGDWTLEQWDAQLGRAIWSLFDGKQIHYRIDYVVDELVKQNQEERNATPTGWKGDWHKVASIPHNLLHSSGIEDAMMQRDDAYVKRWLNNSDNRAWRTKTGQV